MKLLLDTHAFIWWYDDPERLPEKILSACQDTSNILVLSVATAWAKCDMSPNMCLKLKEGLLAAK